MDLRNDSLGYELKSTAKTNHDVNIEVYVEDDLEFDFDLCHGSYNCCGYRG